MSSQNPILPMSLQPLLTRLPPFLQTRTGLLTVTTTILSLPLLRLAVLDYRAWYAIGAGGVPHNPFGWFIQLLLRPLTLEPRNTAVYDSPKTLADAEPLANKAFLKDEDVPMRKPPRPNIGSWVVPHRQLSDLAPEGIKTRIQSYILSLATTSPSLTIATSLAERHGPALFLSPSFDPPHTAARKTRKEIAHMHASDGSMHMSLTPKDAKLVLDKGWGQRHGLSERVIYSGFVMIYAPRDDGEARVVERILRASVGFMTGEGVE